MIGLLGAVGHCESRRHERVASRPMGGSPGNGRTLKRGTGKMRQMLAGNLGMPRGDL